MAIIPGITPKSPVIGEELNSDNFAIVAGQYSVKIDPTSTGLTSSPAGLKVAASPVVPPADFFRSASGATLPDGASDFTEAISHNGNIGIRQAVDPISPLTFGNLAQNDIIRMFSDAPNPHQFYGFGIGPATVRYQVAIQGGLHTFYGGTSATASRQFASLKDRDAIFGEPLAAGEGHWQIGTAGAGDNGYLRFRSPDGAAGANKIQAEILCDGFSGNAGVTGSTMEFRTAATSGANTPLINRMLINGGGDLMVSDPAAPYAAGTGSTALVTINGSLRVRGGAIAGIGGGRQTGGIVFGAGPGGGGLDPSGGALGDSDGGISSSADGIIDIYSNGTVAARFASGGACSKPGGGLWAALSDERVKRDVAAHTPNPTATLALEPIEFFYNGEGSSIDDGKRHVGFSAQALQSSAFSHWVTDGTESIDGEAVRQVDLSNLTFELLGVVKAQALAIEALELRLSALEPKNATAAQVAKRK